MNKRNRSNTNTSNTSALSNKILKNVTIASISNNNNRDNGSGSGGGGVGDDNIDEAFNFKVFDNPDFDVDSYVKNIALKSMFAVDLIETKDKLVKISEKTAEEIKHSVYNNYSNFMETAKEVGHLEGKMTQLRQSLDEQKKLLNLFKNLNLNNSSSLLINSNNTTSGDNSQRQQQQQQHQNNHQQQNQLQQKNMLNSNTIKSSLAMLLEEVEGCGVITQKTGRELIFHSDLESLHQNDYTVSHKLHAYLLSDALLLTLPLRKRTKNNNFKSALLHSLDNKHQYKFQAFYELQDITISNIEDRKEVRNAFQINKFPESLIFRCNNAHLKKEWMENIELARKKLESHVNNANNIGGNNARKNENLNSSVNNSKSINSSNSSGNKTIYEEDEQSLNGSINNSNINDDFNRNKLIRDQFSDFDIYLAQRDFEKAVDLLIRIKSTSISSDLMQQLIYKQKENELIAMLRKDLNISKERGNKGIQKTGKRVVNCLVKLKIYDEALNLFIDYHKTLNSESLKKIKLEESNSIYMNNVMNLFFDNLKLSFISFKESFTTIINFCLSTYLNWIETEIEIVIRKLQSQHYIGRQFDLTIENCELIFDKAMQFSKKHFEVKFFFETKLREIIEKSIKEQKDILIDASLQRSKFDDTHVLSTHAQNEQNKQTQIQKFLNDLEIRNLKQKIPNGKITNSGDNNLLSPIKNGITVSRSPSPSQTIQTSEINIFDFNLNSLNASAIQFSRGIINFFCDLLRIYYQDINYTLIESIVEMFKIELKMYDKAGKNLKDIQDNNNSQSLIKYKRQIENNLNFLFNHVLPLIERLYEEKTKIKCKNFIKLHERYIKFRNENFK